MRTISWNVNGVRAAAKKGLLDWMATLDADLLFLQETKCDADQVPRELHRPAGWGGSTFHSGDKKGYSGVGVYWKREPDEVIVGLGIPEFDAEGRAIAVRYGDRVVWGNYFPNGGRSQDRVDYKLRFYDAMLQRMVAQRAAGQEVLVTGDLNTAHHAIDLARPKENATTSGFLPEERAWVQRYVDEGWVDSFRLLHPEPDRYSWWDQKTRSRERNVGWRIDYWLVPEALADRVTEADILDQIEGSDHAPVTLTISD